MIQPWAMLTAKGITEKSQMNFKRLPSLTLLLPTGLSLSKQSQTDLDCPQCDTVLEKAELLLCLGLSGASATSVNGGVLQRHGFCKGGLRLGREDHRVRE